MRSGVSNSSQGFAAKPARSGSNGVDVTDDLACLGLFGPKSRKLMEKISKDDLTNENFKLSGDCVLEFEFDCFS